MRSKNPMKNLSEVSSVWVLKSLRRAAFKKNSVKTVRKVINYPPLNLLLHYPEARRQKGIMFINYSEFFLKCFKDNRKVNYFRF